jgi:hypothetical protein
MMKKIRKKSLKNKVAYTADVIEITVSGTFKTNHLFNSAEGILGVMTLNAGKTEAVFQGADNSILEIKKTQFWKSNFELKMENKVVGFASSPGALKRAFDLSLDEKNYVFVPGGSKLRSWTIKDIQDNKVCEFLPRRGLKRGARIRIQSETPLALLVLAYIVVIRRWQEESAS